MTEDDGEWFADPEHHSGKWSAFCLKQVILYASGVSKIFLKQEYFTYPTGR